MGGNPKGFLVYAVKTFTLGTTSTKGPEFICMTHTFNLLKILSQEALVRPMMWRSGMEKEERSAELLLLLLDSLFCYQP